MRKARFESELASKLTAEHIGRSVLQLKWYASLWGTLNTLNFR